MSYQSFLSQDEVDALLAGVAGDDSSDASKDTASDDGVRPYDLASPDRVIRNRMQTLELINERFARRMRSTMLSFMRRNADITVGSINILKYSDFERNLPVPSNLNMVHLKPLRGISLFTFDPNLVFLIIDSLFGGHGRYNTRIEGRDFTTTEQRIILRLLELTLESYCSSWEPVYKIDAEYIRSEMHTKFASISTGNELVVVTSFNIEFGAQGGNLNICLPYSMIEPVRDLLIRPLQDTSGDAIDQRWTQQLSRQVRSAKVDLIADFVKINSSVRELLNLKVNDVLPVDIPEKITAHVDGVPILEGSYGTSNHKYAVRVNKFLASKEHDFHKAKPHDRSE